MISNSCVYKGLYFVEYQSETETDKKISIRIRFDSTGSISNSIQFDLLFQNLESIRFDSVQVMFESIRFDISSEVSHSDSIRFDDGYIQFDSIRFGLDFLRRITFSNVTCYIFHMIFLSNRNNFPPRH